MAFPLSPYWAQGNFGPRLDPPPPPASLSSLEPQLGPNLCTEDRLPRHGNSQLLTRLGRFCVQTAPGGSGGSLSS